MSSINDATPEQWDAATKCDRNLPFKVQPTEPERTWRITAESELSIPEPERSLRYNNGKPDFSLLPMSTLTEVVRVLEYGASKYERNNWLKPTSWDISFACLMRHMSAWQAGEDDDPESGRSHLAHAACNILQMLHQLEHHPEELER
jgi:hypothetical protein